MMTFAAGSGARPCTVALVAFYMDWQRSPDLDEMDELSPQLTDSSCELCGAALFDDDEDLCSGCVERGEHLEAA